MVETGAACKAALGEGADGGDEEFVDLGSCVRANGFPKGMAGLSWVSGACTDLLGRQLHLAGGV